MWWPFKKKPDRATDPAIKPRREGRPNSIAIPIPKGMDPHTYDRVPDKLWRSDPTEAARQIREKSIAMAQLTQSRAEHIGATHYIWRTAGDSDVCPTCAKRNGKRFAWRKPPPHGHPAECDACPQGYCRCYAEVVIK